MLSGGFGDNSSPGTSGSGDNSSNSSAGSALSAALESQLRIGDRFQVASVFKDVFGTSSLITNSLQTYIFQQYAAFGRPCDLFVTTLANDCINYANSQAAIISPNTSLREAYRLQACYHILNGDPSAELPLKNVISQVRNISIGSVNLGTLTAPTEADAAGIYSLFFRVQDPSAEIVSNLMNLSAEVYAEDGALEAWRMAALAACTSPDWQIP